MKKLNKAKNFRRHFVAWTKNWSFISIQGKYHKIYKSVDCFVIIISVKIKLGENSLWISEEKCQDNNKEQRSSLQHHFTGFLSIYWHHCGSHILFLSKDLPVVKDFQTANQSNFKWQVRLIFQFIQHSLVWLTTPYCFSLLCCVCVTCMQQKGVKKS